MAFEKGAIQAHMQFDYLDEFRGLYKRTFVRLPRVWKGDERAEGS